MSVTVCVVAIETDLTCLRTGYWYLFDNTCPIKVQRLTYSDFQNFDL